MSTSPAFTRRVPEPKPATYADSGRQQRLDLGMLVGVAIALVATVAGIASTGVSLKYFLQPTGALIVPV